MKLLATLLSFTSLVSSTLCATCNHDNCYRALFPTDPPISTALSSASSFCNSLNFAEPTSVAPPPFPTRAISACGTFTARYVSACSCLDTALPSNAPDTLIKNGGFESGLAPWVVDTTNRGTYSVSAPAHAGIASFGITTTQSTSDKNPPSVQQANIPVTAGKPYKLSYFGWFSDNNAGFIGTVINGNAVDTNDANDLGCCQIWNQKTTTFTAPSNSLTVRLKFLASDGTHTIRIDQVVLMPN